MPENSVELRKIFSQIEEIRLTAGKGDAGGPLRKVAVSAVFTNPFAGQGYVEDLSRLTEASAEIGTLLGTEAARLLGEPVQSYGKGGLAGSAGEQEHVNACVTSVFGNAFRDAIGGGKAWITSVTKPGGVGTVLDIPLAFKDEIWIRSHYDALEVRVPDAPHPDELLIVVAVAGRGRLNARVGGMTVEEYQAKAGA